MIAEIIAIGNEVVDGTVVNTNAGWLSRELSRHFVTVRFHTVIPDDRPLMLSSFQTATQRAQLVLVTGGLGPTVDDFTMEVAGEFFQKPLVTDNPSLERIREAFVRLGRKMSPNQEKQALIPQGASVLPNSVGTAPGIYQKYRGVHFAFFPGVPAELYAMFEKEFLPLFLKETNVGEKRILRVLRCFGIPEGQLDHEVGEDIKKQLGEMGVQLGFRVSFPYIDIRLSTAHEKENKALEKLAEGARILQGKIDRHVFGEGEVSLAEVVGKRLKGQGKTLATAESCTGGLLANEITDVPGASDYFLEGVVSYSNQAKIDLLGVKKEVLKEFGAVSREVALEMAHGIQRRAKSDFAISVTGIAGPTGGTKEKPVGTVHIAVIYPGGEWEREFHFPFGRNRFKQICVAAALDKVRRIFTS